MVHLHAILEVYALEAYMSFSRLLKMNDIEKAREPRSDLLQATSTGTRDLFAAMLTNTSYSSLHGQQTMSTTQPEYRTNVVVIAEIS